MPSTTCQKVLTIPQSSLVFGLYEFDFSLPPGPFVFITDSPATVDLLTLPVPSFIWIQCPATATGYTVNIHTVLTFDAVGNGVIGISFNGMSVDDLFFGVGGTGLVGDANGVVIPPATEIYIGIEAGSVNPATFNNLLVTVTAV